MRLFAYMLSTILAIASLFHEGWEMMLFLFAALMTLVRTMPWESPMGKLLNVLKIASLVGVMLVAISSRT